MRHSEHIRQQISQISFKPGVYIMRDSLGKIIYVGKAKNLKKRVMSYFQKSKHNFLNRPKLEALVQLVHTIDVVEVKTETEALVLENKFIKQWKPKFNKDLTDDKDFLLVRVDIHQPFPSFKIVYHKKDSKSIYYGPFAHGHLLKKTLHEMRLEFGILLGDTFPKKMPDGYYKLYDDARSEIYNHNNMVTIDEYHERVKKACDFLQGKTKEWIHDIYSQMIEASQNKHFEKAAQLRDMYLSLKKTIDPTRNFKKIIGIHLPTPAKEGLVILKETLSLETIPAHIECFDISHISGTFAVASMVCFIDGKPAKKQYRRFKIKSFIGNDDFRAMEEVVSRRYLRIHNEKGRFPDLIVIDGGLGQVHAAMKAFIRLDIKQPLLIGLAKKRETIIFGDGRDPINLAEDNPAIHLLQQVRDEAHRFANTFNNDLRQKSIQTSILEECPGLGPLKIKQLISHFQTIQRLKKASLEDIQAVQGIGPQLASAIFKFLNS